MERKDYMKPAIKLCKVRHQECLLQASNLEPLRRGATKMEYDSEEW